MVEYQIPPNLVSFDNNDNAGATTTLMEKVGQVKEHVKAVMDVITGIKEEQLEEETRKADMRAEQIFAEEASAAQQKGSPFFASLECASGSTYAPSLFGSTPA